MTDIKNLTLTGAAEMLSRPYSLTAPIVHGKQLGRKLGFPTANQAFSKERAVPKFGVYAVRVRLDGALQSELVLLEAL